MTCNDGLARNAENLPRSLAQQGSVMEEKEHNATQRPTPGSSGTVGRQAKRKPLAFAMGWGTTVTLVAAFGFPAAHHTHHRSRAGEGCAGTRPG